MARRLVFIFAVGWVLAVLLSIVIPVMTPATGDGFTRGLNRVGAIALWQGVAFLLAIAVFVAYRRAANRSGWLIRLAGWGPPALSGLVVLIVIATIFWARFVPDPISSEPAAPVTQPVAPSPE